MIPITRLHYRLDEKLNSLASNQHQAIQPPAKDFALYEAILKVVKRKAALEQDSTRKNYQDLQSLIVPHEELTPKKRKDLLSIYEADLSKLTEKFFLPISTYTTCTKGSCSGRIVWIENIAAHSDVPLYLNDTHRQPSFAYQVTFATISDGKLEVYTDEPGGPFVVDKTYISYLRYPAKVCIGGYDQNFDEVDSPMVDCDLPEHLEDEILEIAVQDIAFSTENQQAAQAAQIRAQTNP